MYPRFAIFATIAAAVVVCAGAATSGASQSGGERTAEENRTQWVSAACSGWAESVELGLAALNVDSVDCSAADPAAHSPVTALATTSVPLTFQAPLRAGRAPIAQSAISYRPTAPGTYPVVLVHHWTMTSQSEAPSTNDESSLHSLAGRGFVVISADLPGFGVSQGMSHAYMHAESTVLSVLAAARAANSEASAAGVGLRTPIYNGGYSQGGWTTAHVHRAIEDGAFAGAGIGGEDVISLLGGAPCDLDGLLRHVMTDVDAPNPFYAAYLITGYRAVYGDHPLFHQMFTDWTQPNIGTDVPAVEQLDSWYGRSESANATRLPNSDWLDARSDGTWIGLLSAEFRADVETGDWAGSAFEPFWAEVAGGDCPPISTGQVYAFHTIGDADVPIAFAEPYYQAVGARNAETGEVGYFDPAPDGGEDHSAGAFRFVSYMTTKVFEHANTHA